MTTYIIKITTALTIALSLCGCGTLSLSTQYQSLVFESGGSNKKGLMYWVEDPPYGFDPNHPPCSATETSPNCVDY